MASSVVAKSTDEIISVCFFFSPPSNFYFCIKHLKMAIECYLFELKPEIDFFFNVCAVSRSRLVVYWQMRKRWTVRKAYEKYVLIEWSLSLNAILYQQFLRARSLLAHLIKSESTCTTIELPASTCRDIA